MNKIKSTKGITLISLVVTIIILLILVGVTIATLMGDNGLINRANDAKIATEIASIKEEIQTDILSEQAGNNGNISDDTLKGILEKYGVLSEEEKLIDKTLTTTKGNHEIKVADIFNGTTVKDVPKNPVLADKSGASTPNLNKIAQKTYVTWNLNETGTEYVINDTQTTQPDNWYDYENGKWANIKTTNNGLEAYWVWIPRYEYKITRTSVSQIDVRFIGTDKKEGATGYITQSDGTVKSSDGYTIHPAFTNTGNGGFGELDGIWVAKFEASSNTEAPDTNYGGGEPTTENLLKVQVKPGVQSWRKISANNIFKVCRKMTDSGEVLEGSTVDSHMMKNTEWGAVAILSQSKYGIFNSQSNIENPTDGSNRRIWNNPNGYNSGKYIYTGYVGNSADASTTYSSKVAPTNVIEYNKKNTSGLDGTKASTTGTVYGVYDMAGGSWEYVAGVLKGNSTDGSKDLDYATLKFNITNQGKPEGMTDLNFAKKYLDLYNYRTSSTDYSQYIIGDATVETKGWNSDYSSFVYSSNPVFVRGRWLLHWHGCR